MQTDAQTSNRATHSTAVGATSRAPRPSPETKCCLHYQHCKHKDKHDPQLNMAASESSTVKAGPLLLYMQAGREGGEGDRHS
jgi:hypothetical protein